MLSRWYPTERLQIEFVNTRFRQGEYGEDPLAPGRCGAVYALAVTMAASPLAWMELSNLDPEDAGALGEAIAVYRTVQADLLSGHVLPIGEEPGGTSWTGFQSVKEGGRGYLLLFRELDREDTHLYRLWSLRDTRLRLTPLLEAGDQRETRVDVAGGARFTLGKPLSFALYRYESC